MPTPRTTRQIVLADRPHGAPTQNSFRLETAPLPELSPGEILVANQAMSVDPYMRGRMNDTHSYVPPFQIGQPLDGGAVGEVIGSDSDDVAVGSHVLHGLGWREHAVLNASQARAVDTSIAPASAYLGVLGMPGLTAYAGLLKAGEFSKGDAVFVSGAAGAVGSLVGQIAKLSGASRVIGSAGSAEKVEYLRELGFDAAFNYKDAPVAEQLSKAAPDGIDVYFDNVGGDHLEAALSALNVHGRVTLCGMISQYNATEPAPGPRNLALAIGKRLRLHGLLVGDYADVQPEFVAKMAGWLQAGEISYRETTVDGLERAPQAFIDLLNGGNTGKMVVRV